MTKPRLLFGVCTTVLALAIWAAPAMADPTAGPPICSGPTTPIAGKYRNLEIKGNRYVASGTTLKVRGNLILARGACLDAFTLGTVKVGSNIFVKKGAILALGCTPQSLEAPGPPCNGQTTDDSVVGSIVAYHPLTMYLDGDTIWGNVISIGGGPGPVLSPYVNFPIKDNVVHGNVFVTGWEGAWFGFIRNVADRNVVLTNNVGVTIGALGTPDSTEVVSNTIAGNLICLRNKPPAQIGDSGGSPNTVGGRKVGECAGL